MINIFTWSLLTQSPALCGDEAMDARVGPGHGYCESLQIRAPWRVIGARTWGRPNVVYRHVYNQDGDKDDNPSHYFFRFFINLFAMF